MSVQTVRPFTDIALRMEIRIIPPIWARAIRYSYLLAAEVHAKTLGEGGGYPMIELKQCPKCGRRPLLGYACGEYFIVGQVGGCGVCETFGEMHASREQEAEAWNRRADSGDKESV